MIMNFVLENEDMKSVAPLDAYSVIIALIKGGYLSYDFAVKKENV